MNNRIEIVISVWKDGDFFSRDRIMDTNITKINSQLEFVIENIKNKLEQAEKSKYEVGDDDIPF